MQTVRVRSTNSAYNVLIGSRLLGQAAKAAKEASRSPTALLVTDRNLAEAYLDPAREALEAEGFDLETAVLPPGEGAKTLDRAASLYDVMLAHGMDRGSIVVGLGGGVVTDIAGFVAATYMRGIPWVAVSTSLLGQVDASVGGKTAVDHPECKNLIGAFHQPAAVTCDVAALATLPDDQLRTGLAEVVKHGMIRSPELFALVENRADAILDRDAEVLEEVVARNVRIKASVVEADEREGGLRRILNYGHTIGHALETHLELDHGRAVALGMVAEAHIAASRGFVARDAVRRQNALLERLGLATHLEEAPDVDRCLQLTHHDKKAEAGRLRFVLPAEIGRVEVYEDVTDEEIRDAIEHLVA